MTNSGIVSKASTHMAKFLGGDIKPDPGESNTIRIRVVSPDGGEVDFRIKLSMRLGKLMDVYCLRRSIQPDAIRFLFDGQRIRQDQTPEELGMADGDIIDAMVEQVGGGGK